MPYPKSGRIQAEMGHSGQCPGSRLKILLFIFNGFASPRPF
ncbi:MAG: hypothetical protein OJF62_003333 [Pseudolabrys sp.]|nr:hypothetical protein [Pseudolabrys sp.]